MIAIEDISKTCCARSSRTATGTPPPPRE
jgi:hypothetical protein